MKKYYFTFNLLILIFTAINLLSAEEKKPGLQGSFGDGYLYYFTLHPGTNPENDTVANIEFLTLDDLTISLEIKNRGIFRQKTSNKNTVTEFPLTAKEVQPTLGYDNASSDNFVSEKIYEGAAVKITTDGGGIKNVTVNTQYGHQSDCMTLINSSELSYDYRITNHSRFKSEEELPSNYVSILAVYENTKVTFKLGGSENSMVRRENGDTIRNGQEIKRTLNEGDVWLIPAIGNDGILTGSLVTGNKPVAVYSGCSCGYSPSDGEKCNYTINQEIPINYWDKNYMIPKLVNQFEYPEVTIFAKADSTEIKFNDSKVAVLDSEVNKYLITPTGTGTVISPVEVNSDKQINVVMTEPALTLNSQKPYSFNMQIIGTEQFKNYADFHISNAGADIINIIYKADSLGNIPDDLKIAELVDGKYNWLKLSEYESGNGDRYLSVQKDGRHYMTKNIVLKNNGLYSIKANSPFQVYKYAFFGDIGYGFPVVSNIADLESPDSLAPSVVFTDCCCSYNGIVTDEPQNDPENRANLGLISLAAEDSYNFKLSYHSFIAGQDARTTWSLSIRNEELDARAHLVFIDRVGNRLDTVIECPVKIPGMNPMKIDFGNFKVENPPVTKTMPVELSNKSHLNIPDWNEEFLILDSDSIDVSNPNDISVYQNFELLNLRDVNIFPLIKNENKTVNIKFTASKIGKFKDYLGVNVRFKNPITGEVNKYGMWFRAELTAIVGENFITATDYDFGELNIGESHSEDIYILNTNSGSTETALSTEISGVELTGDDIGPIGSGKAFEISGLDSIANNHIEIMPNTNKVFSVKFEPKESKTYYAEIKFNSDAHGTDNTTILRGTGNPTSVINAGNVGSNLNIITNEDFLMISSKESFLISVVEIYDISGKCLLKEQKDISSENFKIPVKDFTKGVYLIKIKIEGNWITRKILIGG